MSDQDLNEGWTGYGPLEPALEDFACSICGLGKGTLPKRQWLVSGEIVVCSECVRRTAHSFARQAGLSIEDWMDPPAPA